LCYRFYICGCVNKCFFFSSRRRHTRFSRDWSSECALPICQDRAVGQPHGLLLEEAHEVVPQLDLGALALHDEALLDDRERVVPQIGRASCREREWLSGAGVTSRVALMKSDSPASPELACIR